MTAKTRMDTGKMPEKIIAMARADFSTIENLHESTSISSALSNAATKKIVNYFEQYYDNLARRDAYLYQHVYEFEKSGDSNFRLFKPQIKSTQKTSTLQYKFLDAKLPNKNGYLFQKKASVMEFGIPVTIKPKKSDVLVFDINDETIFTKKNILVQNPGGKVSGNFNSALEKYMNSEGQNILFTSGFNDKIIFNMTINHEQIAKKIQSGHLNGIVMGKTAAKTIVLKMAVAENA